MTLRIEVSCRELHPDSGSNSFSPSAEIHEATKLAIEAGELLCAYFGTSRLKTRAKGQRDVVTAADTGSERIIVEGLREAFPADGIVAEEGSGGGGKGPRCWYVDPLDGTLNYSRAIPIWSVSIALFEGSAPVAGVLYDPIRRETFTAETGKGARCNEHPIQTNRSHTLAEAVLHITVDFENQAMRSAVDDVVALAHRALRIRNIGSAALALAYIAAGRFDGMIHRFANAWDYGAGALLVREAGGVISDLEGEPYQSTTAGVLAAANPSVHADLLSTVHGRTARVQ